MRDITNILVPTDFNEDAEKAYSYALEIALRTSAELHLLHVVEEPYDFAIRVEKTVDALRTQAAEKLEKLITSTGENERYKDLRIDYQIERGRPYSTIMDRARKLEVDLIIMGTKGESSLKRILYGNITSDVLLDSEIPVLTVPVNSKKPYLDRYIFATDFRSNDIESLKSTVYMARKFDAVVYVVHVIEKTDIDSEIKIRGFKDLVNEKIDYEKIEYIVLDADRFSQGISKFLTEHPVSLLVITRYKKVFLKTLLWASSTQEMTYHTTVPMLVMPSD